MVKCIPTKPEYFAKAICANVDCRNLESRDLSASRQELNLHCLDDCLKDYRFTVDQCTIMCVFPSNSDDFDNGGLYKDPKMF